MTHTPGPWYVNDRCIEAAGPEGPRDVTVAVVHAPEDQRDANARLIAAAPELLAACEELLIYLSDWDDDESETCVRARAAIAKAEGRE
jgi:hypothetical protein